MSMVTPKSFLTPAVVLTCLSAIALFAGLAIPIIEQNNLNAQIQADNVLTRENARAWGEVPGIRKINYGKTFTVFNLEATPDDILNGKVNAEEEKYAIYNVSYSYKDLQFAPASNGSVQYHKMFQHTYTGDDENVLKETMVQTLNIGAFRGVAQQTTMSRAQIFIQTLYRIFKSFEDDIIPDLVTEFVHFFYISNQTLTNNTIFMYNTNLSPDTSNLLWTDVNFGWSNPKTLKPWMSIIFPYFTNPSYTATSHPNYPVLKAYFQLTDDQMMAFVGVPPTAKQSHVSVLYLVTSAIQSRMAAVHSCTNSNLCDPVELFALQSLTGNVTSNPIFPELQSYPSIAQYNTTFPAPPELFNSNHVIGATFSINQLKNFFAISADRLSPAPDSTQTLFGLFNVEVITANSGNPQAIVDYFGLDNIQQAQLLVQYVDDTIDLFAYQGNDKELANYKYMADAAVSSMTRLYEDIANLILTNLTGLGTYNAAQAAGKNCAQLLTEITPSDDLVKSICGNNELNLDTAEGHATWLAAYNSGFNSSVYQHIVQLVATPGFTETQIQTLLSTTSQLGGIIHEVSNTMAVVSGCIQAPCPREYVARAQWSASVWTLSLPDKYFGGKSYESLVDIYPDYFQETIPEICISTYRNYGLNMTIDINHAKTLLSFGIGSFNNIYEVLKLFSLFEQMDLTSIKARFGFDETTIPSVLLYFDDLFITYHLGGMMRTLSIYDILWGYEDPFLKRLNSSKFFENLQLFETRINLVGEKENVETYTSAVNTMINTGTEDPNNLRVITSFNGNKTLSLMRSFYDGNKYLKKFVSPWGGDVQKISGTDSSGFHTLLEKAQPVSIFEDRFMRNVQYDFESEYGYGKRDYNLHQYSLNIPQFDKSDEIFHNFWDGYMDLTSLDFTPILVSLPYYKDCDPSSYQGVTFGHAAPSIYQAAVEPGKFIVESQTGKTINFTKNYQYNVNNIMPYFNAKKMTPTAIPIVTVMETYVTPDMNFDGDLKASHDRSRNITIVTIISLVLAFLCIVSAIILFRRYVVRTRELSSVVIKCSTQNYSGLYVESDAGNGDSLYQRA